MRLRRRPARARGPIHPEGRRPLGWTEDGQVILEPNSTASSLCFAASGGGKTTGVAMTAIQALMCDANRALIINDLKAEIAHQIAKMCRLYGRKFGVIDDFHVLGADYPYRLNINPISPIVLAHQRGDPDLPLLIENAMHTLLPEPKSEGGGPDKNFFFRDQPRQYMHTALRKLLDHPRLATPGGLSHMIGNPETLEAALSLLAEDGAGPLRGMAAQMRDAKAHNPDLYFQHIGAASSSLKLFAEGALHQAGADAEITHEELLRDNWVVCVVSPVRHIDQLGPYVALHFNAFLDAQLTGTVGKSDFIIDEYCSGPFEPALKRITVQRGFGSRLLLIAQSRKDSVRRYGEEFTTILEENCLVKQYLKITHYEEAERLSKAMGEEHYVSSSLGGELASAKLNANLNLSKQRVLSPAELLGLPPDEQIILISGLGFIRCKKIWQKAIIYCRVSSKGQETDGHGLESQETRCRQYAAAKNYEVVMTFPDTVTGGGDFIKRPGMVSLLAFLDSVPDEKFVVIFDDLKRYARDVEFHLKLRREMNARGATPECLNFNFVDTPEGKFSEIIVAASGQLEREQNKRQVSQKMEARMQNGYYVHAAPIGYVYKKVEGRGKMLFPDAPFASIIREAFEGYASGRFATQAEVTRFFESFPDFPRNKHGRVVQQRTADILTHPVYTGHICSEHYGIHWRKGHHEAIVPLDVFQRVQDRRKGASYAPKRANIGDDFALRGMVNCACCGTPLRSSWSQGLTRKYPYYLCQTKGCEAYGKSIPRDKIEAEVGALLKTLQPSQSLVEMATAMFRHIWKARKAQAKEIVQSGKRDLLRLEKEIDAVLDRIMSASNATIIHRYEEKVESLEKEKALVANKMANREAPRGSFDEKLELALTFLANPWKVWETG